MKGLLTRLVLASAVGALAVGGPSRHASAQEASGSSYALVIGIDNYPSPQWADLRYAVKDAVAVGQLLRRQGFEVTELPNAKATKLAIVSALQGLARRVRAGDRVLMFFAGHGYTETLGGHEWGYLVPSDAGTDSAGYLSMEELQTLSAKLGNAKHQLFVMDSCFGGLMATRAGGVDPSVPGYLGEVTKRPARQVLTAGGKNDQVLDGGPNGHSFFTGFLLEAIDKGMADLDRDGYIAFPELVSYLIPRATNAYQTPSSGVLPGHGAGEFVFRSPVPRVPGATPGVANTAGLPGARRGIDGGATPSDADAVIRPINRNADQKLIAGLIKSVDAYAAQHPSGDAQTGTLVQLMNHFMRSQDGKTYVPFTAAFSGYSLTSELISAYLRVVRKGDSKNEWEDTYLVELPAGSNRRPKIAGAFAVVPGRYDLFLAIAEGSSDKPIATIKRELEVPSFEGAFSATSIILADNVVVTKATTLAPAEQRVRPYFLSGVDITPSESSIFRRTDDLSVLLFIYNSRPTSQRKPDVSMDMSFFRLENGAEKYFNRTATQKLDGASLPSSFDVTRDQLPGSNVVPLATFEPGRYVLRVSLTDQVSGQMLTREVTFQVV